MPAPTLVILNPRAGTRPPRFSRLEARLREALGEIELARTRGPRDATRLAREAVRSGVRRLVVGGGDGTLSEVATGVLDAGLGQEVEIGVLPLGSGCDFARAMGVPVSIPLAIESLASGERRWVDAGRVRYRSATGGESTSCFLNEASFGLTGLTLEWMNRVGRRFGPRAGFALSAGIAVCLHPTSDLVISVDDEEVHAGFTSMVVVANGGFFGGGMRVAPDAAPDDGLFDVVVVGELSRTQLLGHFPALYRGTHISHPAVAVHRGVRVHAKVRESAPVYIDADGESLGCLPASVELFPRAIQIFGLPVGTTRPAE